MNNSKKIKTITFTGISIALVTLLTMLIRVPVIGTKGYVNFGDIAIFIVAAIIGKRTGFLAGSFGSAIADCIGYPIYAPGTFVIKGIEGLICALLIKKNSNGSLNKISVIIAAAVSGIWMVVGYFIYEYFFVWMGSCICFNTWKFNTRTCKCSCSMADNNCSLQNIEEICYRINYFSSIICLNKTMAAII